MWCDHPLSQINKITKRPVEVEVGGGEVEGGNNLSTMTIFMNSENSKTPDPHKLLLNLPEKIDLKGSDIYVALYSDIYTEKYKKVIQKQQI